MWVGQGNKLDLYIEVDPIKRVSIERVGWWVDPIGKFHRVGPCIKMSVHATNDILAYCSLSLISDAWLIRSPWH